MKKYILFVLSILISFISYGQTARVLSGFEPSTMRPGYIYRDTVISLPRTPLKYLTGYGTFGSLLDSVPLVSSTLTWSVLDSLNTPPVSPTTGDIYEVGTAGTGAWSGHNTQIATWSGSAWTFEVPVAGNLLYNIANDLVSKYTGTVWVRVGKIPILQGGQALGANMTIGSTDNFGLTLRTANTIRFQIGNNGAFVLAPLAGTGNAPMQISSNGTLSRGAAVDSIWRTAGQDSIKFSINGRFRSIKDSTGSGGGAADSTFFWKLTGNYGTSYSTNFIGTKDNISMRFRTNNIERARIDSSSGRFRFGLTSNSANSFAYIDSNAIGFFKASVYDSYMAQSGNGNFSFYPFGTLSASIIPSGIMATTGYLTNIKSGNFATNYEPLTLQGGNYTGDGSVTSSIIFNAEFSTNPLRMTIYDNGSTGAPISILPTDGNLIIGGTNTDNVINNNAKVFIKDTSRGFVPPKMTKTQRNVVTSGINTGTVTVAGSGYTDGSYPNTSLTNITGVGTGAKATIGVSGGVVGGTVSITTVGSSYAIGDTLSASIPGGSGFRYAVTSLTGTGGLIIYQTDNTPGLRVYNGTNWVRYTETID